jgi:D-sedoheptulose 7-phosphate isomerase
MMRGTRGLAGPTGFISRLSGIEHVILDRDGVLNEELPDGGHVANPEDFHWLPGALPALATLRASGVRISVATNQSGIGRGRMSELDLAAVHERMSEDAARAQGAIDAIYYCPHVPESPCSCRKPLPGLIERAIDRSGIGKGHTLVVGDAERDLEAAGAAGARAALLRTGKGRRSEAAAQARGIPVFEDLAQLAKELSRQRRVEVLDRLRTTFEEHVALVRESMDTVLPSLADCIELARGCLRRGCKLLACGNGGSAADAQHFVAELVGRFEASRCALPALALAADPSSFTAISNDFGFEQVFARQVEAFARPGDLLIALSTSGNSRNVVQAALAAHAAGASVIAFTGRSGGELYRYADRAVRVPSDSVARIQEIHGMCLHALAHGVDSMLLDPGTT